MEGAKSTKRFFSYSPKKEDFAFCFYGYDFKYQYNMLIQVDRGICFLYL